MASQPKADDFMWVDHSEPHASLRQQMLKMHPEIKGLMGPEYKSKYIASFLVVAQVALSVLSTQWTGWRYGAAVYVLGAPLTQALFLAIHELSHNLFFKRRSWNHMFGIVCNFPIVIPFAESFRFYHNLHHKYQGVHKLDTDIPSAFETWLFRGTIGKFVWYNFQIVFYALRPCLTLKAPITSFVVANVVLQLSFNAVVYLHFGAEPFRFLLLSALVAGGFGLHPLSSHFMSEHYLFTQLDRDTQQETYDYHGWFNNVTFMVGYHRGHHNFPNIPWSKLKQLYAIAPEFFANVSVHRSWVTFPFCFILDPDNTLSCRIKRVR